MRLRSLSSRLFLLLFFSTLLIFPSAAQDDITDITDVMIHDGVDRTYRLHLPSEWDGGPLVVALHPSASSGLAMQILTGLTEAADDHGYAIVYPDTHRLAWNDGRTESGISTIGEPQDDAGYINALVARLVEEYDVDPDQVYLTGNGSGGTLAYYLACSTPETFAKVAIVGALMWEYQVDLCGTDVSPIDMLILQGEQDAFYPPQGRVLPAANNSMVRITSLLETMTFWFDRNGCDETQIEVPTETVVRYLSCEDDTTLNVYAVLGGGNNWMRVGDYSLNQVGVDATEVVTGYFSGDVRWEDAPIEAPASLDGRPRSYRIYVPDSYDPETPTPFVFVLHGRPDSGTGIAYITGMSDVADANNFIAVYPDGLDMGWNYVKDSTVFADAALHDDAAFFRTLIDDLSLDLNLDTSRAYVTGFSNGGFMTHRLACEAPDLFAAFAPVAGSLYDGLEDICIESLTPVPIMLIHGTEDTSIPWEGMRSQTPFGQEILVSASVPEYIAFWTVYNGCNVEDGEEYVMLPSVEEEPTTETQFRHFVDCVGRGEIEIYLTQGAGHTWPGRDVLSQFGNVSMDFSASEVIWEFFSDKQLTTD